MDSQYLLAAQYERGMVQICSLQHPSWLCRIEESKSGVVFACWVPKRLPQRFVLTVARSMSHMTVWSLDVASAVCRIQYPKYGSKGINVYVLNVHLSVRVQSRWSLFGCVFKLR